MEYYYYHGDDNVDLYDELYHSEYSIDCDIGIYDYEADEDLYHPDGFDYPEDFDYVENVDENDWVIE